MLFLRSNRFNPESVGLTTLKNVREPVDFTNGNQARIGSSNADNGASCGIEYSFSGISGYCSSGNFTSHPGPLPEWWARVRAIQSPRTSFAHLPVRSGTAGSHQDA
jgi:hypothetical protein